MKCACLHCNGNIEFDADAAGQEIACPHCGKCVVLYDPMHFSFAGRRPDGPPPGIPLNKHQAESVTEENRVEHSLDRFATGALIMGLIWFVVEVGSALGAMFDVGKAEPFVSQVVYAFGGLFSALLVRTLLSACAEVVRLLRKL